MQPSGAAAHPPRNRLQSDHRIFIFYFSFTTATSRCFYQIVKNMFQFCCEHLPAHYLLIIRQAKDCSRETKARARLSARTLLGTLGKETPPRPRFEDSHCGTSSAKITAVRSRKGGSEGHTGTMRHLSCATTMCREVGPPSACWTRHRVISCFISFVVRLTRMPLYNEIIIVQASNYVSNCI